MIVVAVANARHVGGWVRLRGALWTDNTIEEHRAAVIGWLHGEEQVAFVAAEGDAVVSFAEASLRRDHVNGCDTTPVALLEGIAVEADHRRWGVGRALIAAVESWGRAQGCTELGSDANVDNSDGQAVHRALGFEEREQVVFYRKLLGDAANGSTLS